jgi:glycosyltransferase involved in cell wall biosynthesis
MPSFLRVVIITNSLTGGGAERAMNTLARELNERSDMSVTLIPINSGPEDMIRAGCKIVNINREWKGSLLDTFISLLRFQNALWQERPDVVILNCDLPEFFFSISFSRAKAIVVEHSSKSWESRPLVGKLTWRILKRRTSAVVRVSRRIRTRYPKPKLDLIIENALPVEILLKSPTSLVSTIPRLIFVGRLSPEKDPLMFCEVASGFQLQKVVFGDGILFQELKSQYPDFEWSGRVANPWDSVGASDLLILTSRYEGDGLVLIEAIVNGVQVLVRDNEDFRAFDLPEKNYFSSQVTLSQKILEYKSGKQNFSLSRTFKEGLERERNSKNIASEWASLLLSESL